MLFTEIKTLYIFNISILLTEDCINEQKKTSAKRTNNNNKRKW